MKKVTLFSLILVLAATTWSCDDAPSTGTEPPTGEASSKKQFVYNAMNEWYLWQKDVPDLADDRFGGKQAKQEFLQGFSDARTLYEELQTPDDRFSFFIEDYEEYENQQDGIQAALGLDYGYFPFEDHDIGYVRYVVPDSPAEEAGLERYDVFTAVDGTQLRSDNIVELLSTDGSHMLTMAKTDTSNGKLSFPKTGEITVQSERVVENPIYVSTVIDTLGIKIGYMMYNAFQGNSHKDLNTAFGDFKSQGIDELVLDLRYNGGGAVITSRTLASMVSGLDSSDTYGEFSYNEKKSQFDHTESFLNKLPVQDEDDDYNLSGPINKVSLNQVIVLTGVSTASASEALINSLLPYPIEVIQVGTKTIGKDVGSITLYDAEPDYSTKDNINPDHKKAIQPIVVKIRNADGQDYPNGFTPDGFDPSLNDGRGGCPFNQNDNCVNDISVQTLLEKPPVGDPNDPLLSRAVTLITGQQKARTARIKREDAFKDIRLPVGQIKHKNKDDNMYIEPSMMTGRN